MQDFQNSVYLALLTGGLTLAGVLVGAILEYVRERWRYNREKEQKAQELSETINREFYSPLYFYLYKIMFNQPLIHYSTTFFDLGLEFAKLEYNLKYIKSIEDLLKKNVHCLNWNLRMDITDYLTFLEGMYTSYLKESKLSTEHKEITKRITMSKRCVDATKKAFNIYNKQCIEILAQINLQMEFKQTLPKRIFTKELREEWRSVNEEELDSFKEMEVDLLKKLDTATNEKQ